AIATEDMSKSIVEVRIVPIIRATSSAQARRAAEAVCAGGIPIVEVTMTVPDAIELIKELVKSLGAEVLIGAGTVLDAGTAQRCIDTGAEFIVAPGFDSATVQLVKSLGKPMMSGALTPTEVIAAWRAEIGR